MNQHGSETVREQAAEWFVRMQDAPRDAALQRQLRAWLAADPSHRAEYDALATVWSAAQLIPRQRLEALCEPDPVRQLPERRLLRLALAASVAVVALGWAGRAGTTSSSITRIGCRRPLASAARSSCPMVRTSNSTAPPSCASISAQAVGTSS